MNFIIILRGTCVLGCTIIKRLGTTALSHLLGIVNDVIKRNKFKKNFDENEKIYEKIIIIISIEKHVTCSEIHFK